MPVIDDLIASIEVELETKEHQRTKALKEQELILARAQQDGRSNLTEEEDERVQQLRDAREGYKAEIAGIKQKLLNAREVKAEEEERDQQSRKTEPTAARKPAYDQVGRVGTEERTYRHDTDRDGKQFLMDICRQFAFQDVEAASRLSRRMQEERVERGQYLTRAVGTGAFAGL